MKKKQYKIKIQNGNLLPLEPIDITGTQEGILIFFDEEFGAEAIEKKSSHKASLSENSLKKIWDNPEDDIYNDL